jgi:hypothetical protein
MIPSYPSQVFDRRHVINQLEPKVAVSAAESHRSRKVPIFSALIRVQGRFQPCRAVSVYEGEILKPSAW